MIVVAIIAILAAIAIPQFTEYRKRGYRAELKTIARALKPYAASRGFPVRKEPNMIAHPGGMRPRSP